MAVVCFSLSEDLLVPVSVQAIVSGLWKPAARLGTGPQHIGIPSLAVLRQPCVLIVADKGVYGESGAEEQG